jgi:ABC-type polysaccharide/polyol phosphate transport system ATPase subunit
MNSPTVSNLLNGKREETRDGLAISLEGISVRYRVPHERIGTLKEHAIRWLERRLQYDDFWALRDLNLQVQRGETVGIIGPNGAGKSTLLKAIARVLRPTHGRVWTRGRVVPLLEFGAGFHPELTGRENVFLNGALLGFSHAEMQQKFQRIVDFAELWDFIDAPLRTYSSGMAVRLGFAIASDVQPDILIIDEVFSVGDAAFQRKSAERIEGFRASGATLLLVSHSPESVQSMCDRAVWLDHGRIVADGSSSAVVNQYLARNTAAEAKRLLQEAGPSAVQRWGSREIEIVKVRLLDADGEERAIFQTGECLVLELAYQVNTPIDAPIFGMAIHRHDGLHVTGPNTTFAGLTLPTVWGNGTVTLTIPQLPLLEGLYHISVAVHRDMAHMFDYHDRCYPIRIVNEGRPVQERYGVITLWGEWAHHPDGR